ncbi:MULTISPECIES: hemerythrin domain-containing protein [Micromonospora]|uniref:Hemerythrin domain-containing protein n=1 Tax=Micromonospora zamorensis TaxID=709883 RepID=A0ABZ1PL42_9ACTN|nr:MULTISPECIES: hemerythrin domain-containing protein [Micromonospora]TQJ22449.1 hemerythrin HHE cation binding domain-containing protein [Micromonospora sp. A202]WSK48599.1 hemerythrin domain-containing protein [Micromonospora zamorensis]WTE88690.1 hemerythrin domain-containing protein [Micromonospora zamorensis]WTI23474.1 hemerythrin domain-containing protein [Micromonospora zamorensis]
MSTVPLPPLPPAPEDGFRPGGRSIADIVDREHRQLLALLDQLTGPDATPQGGLPVLSAALSRHLSAEEQYLLPAVRAALPAATERVDAEIAADAGLLNALKGLTDDALTEVAERVRQHVDGVGGLVTELRAVATDEELIRLGNRLEIAEEAAPTRPHPGTPGTPPWNRIVEPAVGVVDKVLDVVTRRPTYLADLPEPPRD